MELIRKVVFPLTPPHEKVLQFSKIDGGICEDRGSVTCSVYN